MINITNEDCMNLMSRYKDNHFELAIVDVPFGIGDRMQGSRPMGRMMLHKDWNDIVPDEKYFKELFRVSQNQIIWGANYFASLLPDARDWLVWDKKQGDLNYSMHELAWTSFSKVPKICRVRAPRKNRTHPCQKPVYLYKYCLSKYAKEGDKILDTHLGSGTIAIACHDFGFDLTACEISPEYYQDALDRLKKHRAQKTIFQDQIPEKTQELF